MSSTMRNAVQRRAHRERGQLQERSRLGLLEKKKDWKLRAQDHKRKVAQLKSLREKAAERNEDEFNFGMLSREGPGTKTSRGKAFTGTVHGDRGNKALDVETVRLLKTQDKGYIATMRNIAAKEVRQLEERYILAGGADGAGPGQDGDQVDARRRMRAKKIVFFEVPEERDHALSRLDDGGDVDEAEGDGDDGDDAAAKEAEAKAQLLEKLGRRLQMARRKLRALATAEQELEEQQAKMAKTATSGGFTRSGTRIKVRERKR